LDGEVARRYSGVSAFGAELDWASDCAVAFLSLFAAFGLQGACIGGSLLAGIMARNKARGVRISGATVCLLLLIISRM